MNRPTVISVIDNEESILASVGSLVRSMGYTVRLFYSAETFVCSSSFADTICLIVDVQMPGMSGLELQALLNKSGSQIPIIFITGFAEPSIRRRAIDGGALCMLDKPFQSDDLIHCINRALTSAAKSKNGFIS